MAIAWHPGLRSEILSSSSSNVVRTSSRGSSSPSPSPSSGSGSGSSSSSSGRSGAGAVAAVVGGNTDSDWEDFVVGCYDGTPYYSDVSSSGASTSSTGRENGGARVPKDLFKVAEIMRSRLSRFAAGDYEQLWSLDLSFSSDYLTLVGYAEGALYILKLYDIVLQSMLAQTHDHLKIDGGKKSDALLKLIVEIEELIFTVKDQRTTIGNVIYVSVSDVDVLMRSISPWQTVLQDTSTSIQHIAQTHLSIVTHGMSPVQRAGFLFKIEAKRPTLPCSSTALGLFAAPSISSLPEYFFQQCKKEKGRDGDQCSSFVASVSDTESLAAPFLKSTRKQEPVAVPLSATDSDTDTDTVRLPTLPNSITMVNGVKIPLLGVGTWNLYPELCFDVLVESIKLGYRLIDVFDDMNPDIDSCVGDVLHHVVNELKIVSRSDIFLSIRFTSMSLEEPILNQQQDVTDDEPATTTATDAKSVIDELGSLLSGFSRRISNSKPFESIVYNSNQAARVGNLISRLMAERLTDLKTSYVDLVLLDSPPADFSMEEAIWSQFEALYRNKLTKSIGVSSYDRVSLSSLLEVVSVKPMVFLQKFDVYHHNRQLDFYDLQREFEEEMFRDSASSNGGGGISNDVLDDGYGDELIDDKDDDDGRRSIDSVLGPRLDTIQAIAKKNKMILMGFSPLSGYPFMLKAVYDPILRHVAFNHEPHLAVVVQDRTPSSSSTVHPPMPPEDNVAASPSTTTQKDSQTSSGVKMSEMEIAEWKALMGDKDVEEMDDDEYEDFVNRLGNSTSLRHLLSEQLNNNKASVTSLTQAFNHYLEKDEYHEGNVETLTSAVRPTTAQIALRYGVEKGIVMLTRAITTSSSIAIPIAHQRTHDLSFVKNRLIENFDTYYLKPLSQRETLILDSLQHLIESKAESPTVY